MISAEETGKAVAAVPPQLSTDRQQLRAEMVAWAEMLWDVFLSQESSVSPDTAPSAECDDITDDGLTDKIRLIQ